MSVTAAALWTNSRARIGMNFTDNMLDDNNITGILAALNAGLSSFGLAERWDWLYNEVDLPVTAGTAEYDVPVDHVSTLYISRENNELENRQRKQAIRYTGITGSPAAYSILNDKIRMYPSPTISETYRHGYFAGFPRVSGADLAALAGVTIDIPQQFMSLAELYVAREICVLLNDRSRHQFVSEQIAQEKREILDDIIRSSSPGVPSSRRDIGY